VWTNFGGASVISFADTIVLGANLAVKYASTTSAGGIGTTGGGISTLPPTSTLNLPFKAGRIDTATCVGDDNFLPAVTLSYAELFAFFSSRFGVSLTEMIALMGAHSVGRAAAANSGFQGGWTTFQSSFSNIYYLALIGIGWTETIPNLEWNAGATIMLKPDVELIVTPSAGCNGFNLQRPQPQSPGSVCPLNNAGLAIVQAFAAPGGTPAFYSSFSSAWTKVTEVNSPNLFTPV